MTSPDQSKKAQQAKEQYLSRFVLPSGVPNRSAKNTVIEPVVVLELAFGNVERQVFPADLVIAADDAALEDAPKAFNRVRVDTVIGS